MGKRIKEQFDESLRAHIILIALADIVMTTLAYWAALWIRYDFRAMAIPRNYLEYATWIIPVIVITTLSVYACMRLYQSIWRFVSVVEAYRIVVAYFIIAVLVFAEYQIFWEMGYALPRGVGVIGYLLSLFFCTAIRFGYRLLRFTVNHRMRRNANPLYRVMIVGAGQAAKELINDMRFSHQDDYQVVVCVDDNPMKKGLDLEGIKIAGNRYDIPELVKEYEVNFIAFAIPSAKRKVRAEILNICKETGCKLKSMPGTAQILNGTVNVTKLRDVQIDELLGRDEVKINLREIKEAIQGKVVMVTGGGGSIGSELCRQIASANPKQLIIFDIYENNAYAIQQELIRKYGDKLNLVTLIGSVRNAGRVISVIRQYHPDIIYHAAAHKHVPLMEVSPCEAVKNNVMGTYKTAKAAAENGVKKFLLISTDKAVNPTSLMGATKRICEMIIQMMSRKYPTTQFMAVRFGNVLGSNGSVIPLFKKQIANGGPVTVTDKNIIRYFMTIPEAVSLVLEASYYGKGGEIFVLDMGEPVKIDDMARNLIKLSGYKPDEDIKIVYTGLRPGEKLYEELLMDEEGMKDTANKLIHIGHPIKMDDEEFLQELRVLDEESRAETDANAMKAAVAKVVGTYHPDYESIE